MLGDLFGNNNLEFETLNYGENYDDGMCFFSRKENRNLGKE